MTDIQQIMAEIRADFEDGDQLVDRMYVEMLLDEIERLHAALDEAWGHANHGQMQCGQCEKTYMALDEIER